MGAAWAIIVAIISIVVTVVVVVFTGVIPWGRESNNKPTTGKNTKKKRAYLGNSNTMEIHDLSKTNARCQIDRMNEDNKVYFSSINEVKTALASKGYDGCKWCLNKYHTD